MKTQNIRLAALLKLGSIAFVIAVMWFIIFMMMWSIGNCYAFDFTIEPKVGIYVPQNKELKDGLDAQVNLRYTPQPFYLFGQYIQTERRMTGQVAGNVNIYGFGAGLEKNVTPDIMFYGQFGYYLPKAQLCKINGTWEEAMNYQWNQIGLRDGIYDFTKTLDRYSYNVSGNLGGQMGVSISHEIVKDFRVGIV